MRGDCIMNARLSLPQLPTQELLDLFEKRFIGFDRVLKTLTRPSFLVENNYPPYDIIKESDDKYIISMAVAGFNRDSLTLKLKEGLLTVEGRHENPGSKTNHIYNGIASRYFQKGFQLTENAEITGAKLEDGMLTISVEVNIPEEKKSKLIEIS